MLDLFCGLPNRVLLTEVLGLHEIKLECYPLPLPLQALQNGTVDIRFVKGPINLNQIPLYTHMLKENYRKVFKYASTCGLNPQPSP
jgi:hypothetical protein